MNKKGDTSRHIIFMFILLILFSLFSYPIINAITEETIDSVEIPTEEENRIIEYPTVNETEDFTPSTGTIGEEDYVPPIYEPPENSNVQIETISNDVQVNTVDGSIADFSMVNSLFSLGSLIQGSFISFTNNNNIYINSLFDASTFTATIDEGGSVEVGQKNFFGELGKVV